MKKCSHFYTLLCSMQEVELVRSISISPLYLTKNLKENILNKLKEDIANNICSDENGYIMKIIEIISFEKNIVSRIGYDINFFVKFKCLVLKPAVGQVLNGNVNMILANGIFLKLGGINILIPKSNLKNFEYIKESQSFKNNKFEIKIGDEISVILDIIKYEKKTYSCIAKLN